MIKEKCINELKKIRKKFQKNKNYKIFFIELFTEIKVKFKQDNSRNINLLSETKIIRLLLFSIWEISKNYNNDSELAKFNLIINNNRHINDLHYFIKEKLLENKKNYCIKKNVQLEEFNKAINLFISKAHFELFLEFLYKVIILTFFEFDYILSLKSEELSNEFIEIIKCIFYDETWIYTFLDLMLFFTKKQYKIFFIELHIFLYLLVDFFKKQINNNFLEFDFFAQESPDFVIKNKNNIFGFEITAMGESYKYDGGKLCSRHKQLGKNCFKCLSNQIYKKYNKLSSYKKILNEKFKNMNIFTNVVFYDVFKCMDEKQFKKLLDYIKNHNKKNEFIESICSYTSFELFDLNDQNENNWAIFYYFKK